MNEWKRSTLILKKALTPNWSAGARCRVLKEATIQFNDNVHYQKQLNK